MDEYEAVVMTAFADRVKAAMLEPGQLLTRKQMAEKLKPRKWKERDFDEEIQGGQTADRTAVSAAFDR
jgi:hypothetical protein